MHFSICDKMHIVVTPFKYHQDLLHQENRLPAILCHLCGIVSVILRLAILTQYWLVTDRWTDRHTTTAYTTLA